MDRLVLRNELALATWIELRKAGVIRHAHYTSATLRALAAAIEQREEVLEDEAAFAGFVTAWLEDEGIIAPDSDASKATEVARRAWSIATECLARPLPPPALDEPTVEVAAGALLYYVNAWGLSLNPEDLDEMAAAMLARVLGR